MPPSQKTYTFTWDKTDGYNRIIEGGVPISVSIGYVYRAVYLAPKDIEDSFGNVGVSAEFYGFPARAEVEARRIWIGKIGALNSESQGLGSWTLNIHHTYDPGVRVLYFGDGRKLSAENIARTIKTVAGKSCSGSIPIGDGGLATDARLCNPYGLAVGPDGSLYIAEYDGGRVRRVGTDGIITTVAGTSSYVDGGDGGPATEAIIRGPKGVAVGPDGSIYIAEAPTSSNRIRRVGPDGIITTVAGTEGYSRCGTIDVGDGGPATEAFLCNPYGVAVASDGTLYIADTNGWRIRRVGTDGIITTVAGNGVWGWGGDGGLAVNANLNYPNDIAIGPDSTLYIADTNNHCIRHVGADGIITAVAGTCSTIGGNTGDGGLATDALLAGPVRVAVGPKGDIYITGYSHTVRRVGEDGIINTVAGNGQTGYSGDGGPATSATLGNIMGMALGPYESFYISSDYLHVRMVQPALAGVSLGDIYIPSEDSSEIYVFNSEGKHQRTLDALSGSMRYQFTYGNNGKLISVEDSNHNLTTIERDANDNPLAIVGPFGQRTTLGLDANGYLKSIANPAPAGESHQFVYSNDGLLKQASDPKENTSYFEYDPLGLGRLILDTNAAGGYQELTRTELTNGYEVSRTTAMGRVTTYRVENLSDLSQRRLNTFPEGVNTEIIRTTDGSQQINLPDGTKVSTESGLDPRFGMLSPIVKSRSIKTPSGLTSVATAGRQITLNDPNNILSLSTLTDTWSLNGNVYTETFNANLRQLTFRTPEGREAIATFDSQGRLVGAQRTGLAPRSYGYGSPGRIVTITDGSGTNIRVTTGEYNSIPNDDGLVDRITDPELSVLNFRLYDNAGRLKTLELPDANQILLDYDQNGNLISLAPPGRPAHTFTYTPVNLGQDYIPPDVGAGTNSTHYNYNLDGQLDSITRPDGKTIVFTYKPNSTRIETISTLDGASEIGRVTFVYYPSDQPSGGNLASITAPDGGTLGFLYDGSLLTGYSWAGTVNGSIGFTYNNDFRFVSETVNGGDSIGFQYDRDGLLKQAGAMVITRDDPARPETKNGLVRGTLLDNVSTTLDYNEFGEIKDFTATFNGSSGPVTVFETHYPVRDKLGRIKEKVETVSGVSNTYNYEYDQVGRLWKVSENGVLVRQYEYDANGNRLIRKTDGSLDVQYDNQDRLLQYGGTTYTYTANGELMTKTDSTGQTKFTYDVFGNLTHVELPDGTIIDYIIDGANRRIGKKINGTLIQGFLYSDQLKVIAELDGAGNVTSRFTYGSLPNVPDLMTKGGKTYRIISDHLGSARLVVDTSDGTTAQRLDYDEFGNIVSDTNPGPGFQPFGFAGGIYDLHTNLVRFGVRDYDASIGRWTTKDPMLFAGRSTNLYSYGINDPINNNDPSGTSWEGAKEVWYHLYDRLLTKILPFIMGGSPPPIISELYGLNKLGVQMNEVVPKMIDYKNQQDRAWLPICENVPCGTPCQ